jgi:translation initiation factor 6 (eIF-6)
MEERASRHGVIIHPQAWVDSLEKQPQLKKVDMRFGTWNVRSLYRAGLLRIGAEEISK